MLLEMLSVAKRIKTLTVTFPNAMSGNNSTSIDWIVGSRVSNDGRILFKLMKTAVTTHAKMVARSIDL